RSAAVSSGALSPDGLGACSMAEEDISASIEVYLTVENGLEAIAFYEKAFGAKVAYKELTPDGARLQHATLAAFGGHFMLSDYSPEYITDVAPRSSDTKGSIAVQINLQNPLEVDGAIARAVAAGAGRPQEPAGPLLCARVCARPTHR